MKVAALTVEVRGRDIVDRAFCDVPSRAWRANVGCAPPAAERLRCKNVEVSGRCLGSRLWQSERSRLAL